MNPRLYGQSVDEGIVALHQKDDYSVRLYVRTKDSIEMEDDRFYPFFFLSDKSYLSDFPGVQWLKELEGSAHYRYLCAFETWGALWDAARHILAVHNSRSLTKSDSITDLDLLFLPPDPLTQYLLQTGKTLFKGMTFGDLHRLQLDIETYSSIPGRFSHAGRSGDRIIMVALSDNKGWETLLDGKKLSEKEMLHELVRVICSRDPDVIEGHNIYEFDLPYIIKRCEMHGVLFGIGRDGSVPTGPFARGGGPNRTSPFPVTEVAGRQVIDTYLLVRSYDQSKHTMESHGLKYAAQFFGLAAPGRTYVQAEKIAWLWDHDPAPLREYAMDDVRETRALSDHLSGTYFHLSQIVPMTYSGVLRSGSATKIEHLLVREYLRLRHSIPRPSTGFQTTGGYTDIFSVGILGPIVHADIESLYPSIMIRNGISPRSDILGVFPDLLRELTDQRLAAKRAMKSAEGTTDRSRLDALQSSLKILINSFYGYLGYGRGLFNDFSKADEVTTEGQRLLRLMIGGIRAAGGTVVEVDTDGIFFVPPEGTSTEQQELEFVHRLSETLPEGISVALDGRYRKMLSYKKKNYALQEYDGSLRIKGSSLTSRTIERFGRTYIRKCIEALIDGDIERLHSEFIETRNRIIDRRLSVREFTRVEALGESLSDYLAAVNAGKRTRSAAYEVAGKMDGKPKKGDRIAYYISGDDPNPKGFESSRPAAEWDPNFPDENVLYYLRRLDEFSEKFKPFLDPQDYRRIFSAEDLFPFSPEGIQILPPAEVSEASPSGT